MTYNIQIRPKRQATLPSSLLVNLGVDVGDSLLVKVEGKKATITPKKEVALNALNEIQKAFSKSGVPEKSLQKEILKNRASMG